MNKEKINNIKEISLRGIKNSKFSGYKLIKFPFFSGKYSLILSFKVLFKDVIFPLCYLIFAPIIILMLDKKIYGNLNNVSPNLFYIEVNVLNKISYPIEKFIYLNIGLFLWVLTPFFIINSVIVIFIKRIFFDNYNWDELITSINDYGYSPDQFESGYIMVNKNNILLDGNHRYKILKNKYGSNYTLNVKEIKNTFDYDWKTLKKNIDKYGYAPKRFFRGHLKVRENMKNGVLNYDLKDGHHRYKLLCEKYGENYLLDVKLEKKYFFERKKIKKIGLCEITPQLNWVTKCSSKTNI